MSVEDHPSGSEKLWLCKVDVGGGQERQASSCSAPSACSALLCTCSTCVLWAGAQCLAWPDPEEDSSGTKPAPAAANPVFSSRPSSHSLQVVAGLKQHISREELTGRLVALVLNLRPAKLAGELSEAMIMVCASNQSTG